MSPPQGTLWVLENDDQASNHARHRGHDIVACWDIKGKALGQPVYRLLGGAVRDRIKLYANGWYRTERTPEAFADAARAAVAKGYRALKFDPFGGSFFDFTVEAKRVSVAIVAAVREAVGPDVQQTAAQSAARERGDAGPDSYSVAARRRQSPFSGLAQLQHDHGFCG